MNKDQMKGKVNDAAGKAQQKVGEMTDSKEQQAKGMGKQVKGKKKTVVDGPFAEAKDLVGGYLLVTADNLDDAAELARGCPILEVDGAVEIRPIRKM